METKELADELYKEMQELESFFGKKQDRFHDIAEYFFKEVIGVRIGSVIEYTNISFKDILWFPKKRYCVKHKRIGRK